MNLKKLNQICFTTCILCIVIGTVLSIVAIWAEIYDNEFVTKSWLTVAVLFFAAALTLSVNKTMDLKRNTENETEDT